MGLLFNVHSFPVVALVLIEGKICFPLHMNTQQKPESFKKSEKRRVFQVFRPSGRFSVVKTGQSMPAGRVAASIGRPPAFAGKVTVAKTEHSTVVGRLTMVVARLAMSAGRVPAFTGKLALPILRVTVFVGKLQAFVGETAKTIRLAAIILPQLFGGG
jgi:hypothetical protein